MISPNIDGLKLSDNLKWDFQKGYQLALQIFNYEGEETDIYNDAVKSLMAQMNIIKAGADLIIKETGKMD